MKLSGIDLNLMVAFEAMWEERSVSRSAERLGIRQPAMSATLSRLRELLDDPLFIRLGSRMQPTPRATALAPSVVSALAQLREGLEQAKPFEPAQARGDVFSIASTDYSTMVLLPTLVRLLRTEAPGVNLRVIGYDKADIEDMLLTSRIDVALGVFPAPPDQAVKRLLCEERFVGVARKGHPALAGPSISLDDFCEAPQALVSIQRDMMGAIDKALSAIGRTRRVALCLPHMLTLPAILPQCDLLAALPERVVHSGICDGLQVFELPFAVPGWNIEMLWNGSSRNNEATAWLRSCIQRAAQEA